MALNFPNSPGIGSVYTDTTSGFSYEWDGTVWKSYSAASTSNIKIIDDISGSFNGSTQAFALTVSGVALIPGSAQSIIITLGGVTQEPNVDYTVSSSNIIFTDPPEAALSFSGISLGPATPTSYANDGNVYIRNTYTGAGTTGPFSFSQGYTVGYLDVYRNGVRLRSGTDFTATTGTNFYLTDAAAVDDELEAVGYLVSSLVQASSNLDNLNVTDITTTGRLQVTTNANIVGIVTASSFVGPLTGNATGLTGSPSITVTNATVNGVLSVAGTSVILNAATLQVKDKDIVVGYTTDANNNDVSTDTTANHGGIAVASTEGSPILNLPIQPGITSNPPTYKQFMWIKQGNYSGMGTDAWVSNYAISIGNTSSVQNRSRLTVGTGFTVYDAGNVTAGVITATSFVGSGAQLTGLNIPAGYTELDSMLFG